MPDILHQFPISVPSASVFKAFTSPVGLNAWWTLEADGIPERDSIYHLYFGPQYDWQAKVTHVVADRELTWSVVRAMEDWMPTRFGFALASTDGGTCVRFFHSGWKVASDHFAVTNFCWGQLLMGLKIYLESGRVIPFEQRN